MCPWKRPRWDTLGDGLDLYAQIALHDGHGRDVHILAHHYGAGSLIHHDYGRAIGLDREVLHLRYELGAFPGELGRQFHSHQTGVVGMGYRAEPLVERLGDAAAVTKSGRCICSFKGEVRFTEGAPRSRIAPFGILPTVG